MIASIIKANVCVTQTAALIINSCYHAKTEFNNCFELLDISSTYLSFQATQCILFFSFCLCNMRNLAISFPLLLIKWAAHGTLV